MNPSIVIIVPCYNEAARFRGNRFREYLASHPNVHFLFVDDGSKDDTAAVLEAAAASCPGRAGVLRQAVNGGKGEAVRAGILAALDRPDATAVGFWDADLATPLEAIEDLVGVLDAQPGIEMVFGARVKLLGRDIQRQAVRHYLGRIFATVVSVVLRLPIYDSQCGAKLFRAGPGTRALFAEPFSSRWIFDVEILARHIVAHQGQSARTAAAVYEFPLRTWKDIAGSKVRPRDFLRAFLDILRIYRRYFRP